MARWTPLLLVAALGCTDKPMPDTGTSAVAADYSAPGPYTAGTGSSDITGTSGVSLTVQYWYPSPTTAEGTPLSYDNLYEGGAYEDLDAACDRPRPVLLFSHGYGGVRWQSPFFTEHLASHGYIVAAPDHTYNTFIDNDNDRFVEVVERRPEDLRNTFDWLIEQGNDPDSPLYGCIDATAGYAVAGHSFGGYTAYATAGATIRLPGSGELNLGDDRVWAAIPMAPWDVDGVLSDGTAAITVPVMTLSGTLDTTTDWPMVSGLHSNLTVTPRYLGEFPAAGHYSFAPIACLFDPSDNGCGEGFIDEETFTSLVNVSALSFLEASLGVRDAIDQLPEDSADLSWEIVD